MRILEHHVCPISGHTYAVIVNPIAGGLAGQPAYCYRLICALIPDWIFQINTTRSVSRTPGILIYKEFDVLEPLVGTPGTEEAIAALLREARNLGTVLGGAHHLVPRKLP